MRIRILLFGVLPLIFEGLFITQACGLSPLFRPILLIGTADYNHPDSIIDGGNHAIKFVKCAKIPGGYLLSGYTVPPSPRAKVVIVSSPISSANNENDDNVIRPNRTYMLNLQKYFDGSVNFPSSLEYSGTLNILLWDSVLCVPVEGQYTHLFFSPSLSGLYLQKRICTDNSSMDSINAASFLSSFMTAVMQDNDSLENYIDTSMMNKLLLHYMAGTRAISHSRNYRKIRTRWEFHKLISPAQNNVFDYGNAVRQICDLDYQSNKSKNCTFRLLSIQMLYAKDEESLMRTKWIIDSSCKEIVFRMKKNSGRYKIIGFCTPCIIPVHTIYR